MPYSTQRPRWRIVAVVTTLGLLLYPTSLPPVLSQQPPAATPSQRQPITLTGNLESSIDSEAGKRYYDAHTFEGKAGEAIVIDMDSPAVDSYLILLDPDGKKIGENDDGGDDTNARLVATLPTTGTYTIIANTAKPKEQGSYTLTLRPATPKDFALAEAAQLNQQVVQRYHQGKYAEAIPLAQRALAIREQVLGAEHPDVAASLNNLALLYQNQGNYSHAEPLYQRALAIFEQVLGAEHPDVAASLNNLAELYKAQGNYSQAEPLYQRALAIFEQVLGADHPHVATNLNNLAGLYYAQGNYSQAEPLYQRTLAIREQVLGADHPHVATSLNDLAGLYYAQGNYSQAEPLYQRALAIREQVLGADHPDVATNLNNLAGLYHAQGNYSQAEPLFRRALVIQEQVLGADHPHVATSLNNLAGLYYVQGNYSQAEPLYQRALVIREQVLGADHPHVATSLNNLALLYKAQGNYSQVEPLYQRALAIVEKVLGAEHPDVATNLNNLAGLYQDQGNYSQAEPLYQRALAIFEQVLGADHPHVATNLNNLAGLYQDQGNYSQAEPLYQRALAIVEQVLGAEHPDVATNLNNLAGLYQEQGDVARAIDWLDRGMAVEEHNLALILAAGSEQRKQAYMATLSGTTNIAISLHLQGAPTNPAAARLALTTLLRRKGRVLDAVASNLQDLRQRLPNTPTAKSLFDEWVSVLEQLSALTYKTPDGATAEQVKQRYNDLEARREDLETRLANLSAEFRQISQPVTIADLQARLPKQQTALVEFVQYQPYNPRAARDQHWGKSRYAAVVLRATGDPQWVDLGDAAALDQTVKDLTTALAQRQALTTVKDYGRKLDAQVLEPLRPLLGDAHHLIVSPDSALNLVPFEALVNPQGQYRIEQYAFSYLTTGRDILRFQALPSSQSPPVLLANPDYNAAGSLIATNPGETGQPPTASRGGNDQDAVSLDNLPTFQPLAGTQAEVVDIQRLVYPQARLITDVAATEAAIKGLQPPSILMLATHGFFQTATKKVVDTTPIESGVGLFGGQPPQQTTVVDIKSALLRSGLALAGVNQRQQSQGNSDGVLTALEIAGLNLWGTQLVVLSACESGLGDISAGDGVYGLRRALVIAGSQSQVVSLWKVSDAATPDLMVPYFQNLKRGMGRHEALRQAQLAMLKNPAYQHPYFWAAFIPLGDWTPMKMK